MKHSFIDYEGTGPRFGMFGSDFLHVTCEIFFSIKTNLYHFISAYQLLRDSV